MSVACGFVSRAKPSGIGLISVGCLKLQVPWATGKSRGHVSVGGTWIPLGESEKSFRDKMELQAVGRGHKSLPEERRLQGVWADRGRQVRHLADR